MMAIQTAYQAYNELHPLDDDQEHHEKHGIVHDFKESLKEVVHQITGKDEDTSDKDILVENEYTPQPIDDDEIPQFSKTGYINPAMNTFITQDGNQNYDPKFSESSRSLSKKIRRQSKTGRELISGAGDDILEIKVVSNEPIFQCSANETLIDAGKHVEVLCEPLPLPQNKN
jgi:gas vesicle protein